MNWTPESDEWKQYQPRQGMICNRAIVNRSEAGSGKSAVSDGWCRHLPVNYFDFGGDYSSRRVCSGVKFRNQHNQCLNTGRRYGLTDARTAEILLSSKSYLHNVQNSKTNNVNRSASSWQCGCIREGNRAAHYRLRSSAQSWHSFFTRYSLSACGKAQTMSTLSNPSCVCDTHSPLEALLQRSTDWEALEPVTPPPFGNPSPDDVLRLDAKRHNWPVFLVNVPDDWEPNCWRSVPPHTQTYRKAKTAAEVAAILNRERIANSKDGYVSHWLIRVKVGGKYANLSVALNTPFKPRNEYDMPPAFITIDGSREQCKQIVGELNNRLDNPTNGEKRKRAYIARSCCPSDLQ